MPRPAPRVLPEWCHPKRADEEAKLRKTGLQTMPAVTDKLECLCCRNRTFRVWFDRVQCIRCRLYIKIEGPKQSDLTKVKLGELRHSMDGTIECPTCYRHTYHVYADRLRCIYCLGDGHDFTPPLIYWWPLESTTTDRRVEKRVFSRSAIYRDVKKIDNQKPQEDK